MQILYNIYSCSENMNKNGYSDSVVKIETMITEMIQETINIKLFEEIDNLVQILKGDQQFEDKLGQKSQQVLQIWEDSALGILNSLELINSIINIEYEDEEEEV